MNNTLKIALIPLDNRPVSYTLPQQTASLNKNIKVFAPPREFLGGLFDYSKIDKILEWLDTLLKQEKIDYIAASLDTIAYGGLIPSRRLNTDINNIIKNLNNFKNIITNNKSKPAIYAFSSIMRISDSYVNEEEKEYWDKFGRELFKYSYLRHKIDVQNNYSDINEFNELKTKIPAEILQDYIKTRERNFSVNRFYINWIQENFLDFLVFSKDDTGQYGINVQEAEALEKEILEKNIFDKAAVHTGADEIPTDLVSRAIVDSSGEKVKIFPIFSTKNGKNIISRYEDKTIQDSATGQIKLCGGAIADSAENADMILLLHTPEKIQNDHCLKIYPEQENKEAVKFCTDYVEKSEKPVIIGDISCANGGDNLLVMKLLEQPELVNKIYGYAGWNTTGNTLGSVISIGISRFIAEKTNNFDLNNFKKTLLTRLSDDWAYQTIARQKIRAITDIADKITLHEELAPLIINLAKKINYDISLSGLMLGFPWSRTFEAEIVI